MKVDLKGIDEKTLEKVGQDGYFTREKKQDKSGEEAFFKQGEKPEVSTIVIFYGVEGVAGDVGDTRKSKELR